VHTITIYGESKVHLHSFSPSALGGGEVSSQLHAPVSLRPEQCPQLQLSRGWTGSRAGLDVLDSINISHYRESIQLSLVRLVTAAAEYTIRYLWSANLYCCFFIFR
jgi:hypothetical protein